MRDFDNDFFERNKGKVVAGGCLVVLLSLLLSLVLTAVIGAILGGLVWALWTYVIMGLVGGPAIAYWIFFVVCWAIVFLCNSGRKSS